MQWVIFDWYANDFEQSQKEKEKDKKVRKKIRISEDFFSNDFQYLESSCEGYEEEV